MSTVPIKFTCNDKLSLTNIEKIDEILNFWALTKVGQIKVIIMLFL